jgi:hypothetical protein
LYEKRIKKDDHAFEENKKLFLMSDHPENSGRFKVKFNDILNIIESEQNNQQI